MRKSFWEYASEFSDFDTEALRIEKLFSKDAKYLDELSKYTVEEYIDRFFFQAWAFRHRITNSSIMDLRASLGIENLAWRIKSEHFHLDLETFLLFLEFVYNITKAVAMPSPKFIDQILSIQRNIQVNCARLNFEVKADNENRYIIVEKNAAATAVADQYISSDKDFSFKVIEYNHFLLRGNLARKKEILLALGEKFEPLRPKLKSGSYSQVESDAGFLLNNLNLRHNNVTPGTNGNYHVLVAGMSAGDLEEWYDKTYDALLFALQADNYIDLSKNVGTLKKQINAADKPTP